MLIFTTAIIAFSLGVFAAAGTLHLVRVSM